METARNLTPRQIWMMRIDEAMAMVTARSAMLAQARQQMAGAAKREHSEDEWVQQPDGSRVRRIRSVDGLKRLFAT